MIRTEFENLSPGDKLKIGPRFIEDPDESVEEFLDTVQTIDRIDFGGTGWVYFKDLPQPFAFSEIECVHNGCLCIDDETTYDRGDLALIFGGVT